MNDCDVQCLLGFTWALDQDVSRPVSSIATSCETEILRLCKVYQHLQQLGYACEWPLLTHSMVPKVVLGSPTTTTLHRHVGTKRQAKAPLTQKSKMSIWKLETQRNGWTCGCDWLDSLTLFWVGNAPMRISFTFLWISEDQYS